jgi:hypothetical protein
MFSATNIITLSKWGSVIVQFVRRSEVQKLYLFAYLSKYCQPIWIKFVLEELKWNMLHELFLSIGSFNFLLCRKFNALFLFPRKLFVDKQRK